MNTLSALIAKFKLPLQIASLCTAILFGSWLAGQCRAWRTPPPNKPLPPIVDAGIPIAGPSSQAPTVAVTVPMARPDLTREELSKAAAMYGMVLTPIVKAAPKSRGRDTASISPEPAPVQTFPMLLAEESFKHAPSNADVDVSAWLPAAGQRVDLRASWREWTPPPAAPAAKQVVCQSTSFFANEARWYGGIGAGIVANSKGAGLGPTADLGYLGPRTGKVTWGAGSHAAFSQQSGFQGDASFRMSW